MHLSIDVANMTPRPVILINKPALATEDTRTPLDHRQYHRLELDDKHYVHAELKHPETPPPPSDLFLRNAGVNAALITPCFADGGGDTITLQPRDTHRFTFAQPFRLRIEAAG